MTPEKIVLYEIRDTIAQMSEDDRIKVEVRATTLRNILKGDEHAAMAFALVGAELAASG
jgi:hypothetical protein